MNPVDSRTEKLDPQEIVIQSMGQSGSDIPLWKLLLAFTKEAMLETADVKQFGNTIFLAQRGVGDNKNKMVGRAFNLDTGKRFVANALNYIDYLQSKGITHYSTNFEGQDFLNAFKIFARTTRGTDTTIRVGRDNKGMYIALVKIGKDPIPEGK